MSRLPYRAPSAGNGNKTLQFVTTVMILDPETEQPYDGKVVASSWFSRPNNRENLALPDELGRALAITPFEITFKDHEGNPHTVLVKFSDYATQVVSWREVRDTPLSECYEPIILVHGEEDDSED